MKNIKIYEGLFFCGSLYIIDSHKGGDVLGEPDIFDTARKEEYFVKILNEYEKLVFSVCFRMTQHYFDAEDLTQETFLAFYKALPGFDGENPSGFLTRIATNKCLDYLKRAERRTVAAEDEVFAAVPAKEGEPETLLLEKEVETLLNIACTNLKPPYSDVALAYYCRGQTGKQIAEASGRKVKTVQTQLRRAKAMLQKQLKKEGYIWHT